MRQAIRFPLFPLTRSLSALLLLVSALATLLGMPALSQAQTSQRAWVESDATKRVALVIGNGNYQNGSKLKNPVNDATQLAIVLRKLNFVVTLVKDATNRQMVDAVNAFSEQLSDDCIALAYYSGHGVQIEGVNYLLPIDFNARKASDVAFEAFPATRLLAKFAEHNSPVNIVILDACRNNPFQSSHKDLTLGLVKMDAPKGTLIAYSTSPGNVADDTPDAPNGMYTGILLKELGKPGTKIEDVFKQVLEGVAASTNERQIPWFESSIRGLVYLQPGAMPAPTEGPGRPLDTTARIRFDISPANATIEVEGKTIVGGRFAMDLPDGSPLPVRVTVVADNYKPEIKDITLTPGKTMIYRTSLVRNQETPVPGAPPLPETKQLKRRWKVMVIVPETHIARPHIPDPAVETELSRQLIDAGYKVIDSDRIAELRYSAVMDRIVKGGEPAKMRDEVVQLGRRFGADILVTGEAFTTVHGTPQQIRTDLGNVTTMRCAARVELKAIRMDTGEKVYADSVPDHVGPSASSEELSSKACLEEAASEIAPTLLQKLDKLAADSTQTLEIHIRGIGNATRGQAIEEALAKLPGVRDVSPGAMDGNTYEIEIEVDKTALRQIAAALESSPGLAKFRLKVQQSSGSKIIVNSL